MADRDSLVSVTPVLCFAKSTFSEIYDGGIYTLSILPGNNSAMPARGDAYIVPYNQFCKLLRIFDLHCNITSPGVVTWTCPTDTFNAYGYFSNNVKSHISWAALLRRGPP